MERGLYLVSTNPEHVPDATAIDKALEMLKGYYSNYETLDASTSEHLECFGSGADLESVKCNFCQSEIVDWFFDKGSSGELWADPTLRVTLPCCGKLGYLPDLTYDAPCAFARFGLHIFEGLHNDDARANTGDVSDEELKELEKVVGCSLQRVWFSV